MKKLKNVLSILLIMTTLTVSAISVYADDIQQDTLYNYNEMEDDNIYVSIPYEKIEESEKIFYIKNGLYDFITENKLKAQIIDNLFDEKGKRYILVNYYYIHNDVQPIIEQFINEKLYDTSMVKFNCAGCEHNETNEKITDIYEKLALIDDYIKENTLPVAASIELDYDFVPAAIHISINSNKKQEQEKISQSIKKFINEKNIDGKEILMSQYLKNDAFNILGDANEDNNFDIRDCAYIASMISQSKSDELPRSADFNGDSIVNIRDAAAVAKNLASAEN